MRAYKTELDLNNKQITACLKTAGAARWAYNWGLTRKIEVYKALGKSPTAFDLSRELNSLKKTEFPWLYDVSSKAIANSLKNLDKAFENFYRNCKNKEKKKGFPQYKSKKKSIGNFTVTGIIHIREKSVQLPRLGKLRIKEKGYLPVGGRVTQATVSTRAGKWFVSVLVDEEPSRKCGCEFLGVDVGILNLATLSDGTIYSNPKILTKYKKRLRLLRKDVDRKKKGGKNREKAVKRLAKFHYRVACLRENTLHHVSDAIAKRAYVVGVEDLHVRGLMKNRHVSFALADASVSSLLLKIAYKVKWGGGTVVKVDRFYPSSKTCSSCGHILDKLPLSVREWTCPVCNSVHDRDINAAINLRNVAVGSTVSACCPGSSGSIQLNRVKLLVGQEPNIELVTF